jgi:hypothetical protein
MQEARMTIRILRDVSNDPLVSRELLAQTIETNRDRVRTSADMLLTLSGIVLSASFGFLLYVMEKRVANPATLASLLAAILCFLMASYFAIETSFLRGPHAISSESQFVADLLAVFNRELGHLRAGTRWAFLGLSALTVGVLAFFFSGWR